MDEKRQPLNSTLERQWIRGSNPFFRFGFDPLEYRDEPAHNLGARHGVSDHLREDFYLLLKRDRTALHGLRSLGMRRKRFRAFSFKLLLLAIRYLRVGGGVVPSGPNWFTIECQFSAGQGHEPRAHMERFCNLVVGCGRILFEVPFYKGPTGLFASQFISRNRKRIDSFPRVSLGGPPPPSPRRTHSPTLAPR